jgi:chorismate mutase
MKDLVSLREEIDQLDTQLWEIIGKRVDVAREIGEWKRLHDESVMQPERFQQVRKQCLAHAQQYGLSEALVNEVMEALHKESIKVESTQ